VVPVTSVGFASGAFASTIVTSGLFASAAVRSAACASVAAGAASVAAASVAPGKPTGRTKMLLLLIADSQPASHTRQAAANSARTPTPTLIRVPPGTKHPSQELSERWLTDCRYRRFRHRMGPEHDRDKTWSGRHPRWHLGRGALRRA